MVLAVLTGWLDRQERQALAYLMDENRVLRRQLGQSGSSSLMPTGDGWRSAGTGWDDRSCSRSPPS
jgi:hypothetical protein